MELTPALVLASVLVTTTDPAAGYTPLMVTMADKPEGRQYGGGEIRCSLLCRYIWIDIYLNQILDIQIFNVTTVARYLGPGV